MGVAGVLLAAGGGSRFAGNEHKLRAPFRGRPLVQWAVEAACGAGLDEVFVVVGALALDDVLPAGVTVVRNDRWAEGQATSVRAGIAAAAGAGHDAVVVGLGDQPLVPAEAWRTVAAAPDHPPVAVAVYQDRRRNPVRLARSVWPLLPATGDEGARALLRERPELVQEVACPGESADVDTVEDLQAWS